MKLFSVVIMLVSVVTVMGGLFEERFGKIKNVESKRGTNEAMSAIFNYVYPRRMSVNTTRNHIIPASAGINALFNKLLTTSEGRATLVKMLRDLHEHLQKKLDKPGTSTKQIKMHNVLEKTKHTIDCLDENIKEIFDKNGSVLVDEDLIDFCLLYIRNIHFLFEWHPGNLFLAPSNRLLDGGMYRDEDARHIFPVQIYQLNNNYNDLIIEFLTTGDAALLDEILSHHRRLLAVSDEMYQLSLDVSMIPIDTQNEQAVFGATYFHIRRQRTECMKQMKFFNKIAYDKEVQVMQENERRSNEHLYKTLKKFELLFVERMSAQAENERQEVMHLYEQNQMSGEFEERAIKLIKRALAYCDIQGELKRAKNERDRLLAIQNKLDTVLFKEVSDIVTCMINRLPIVNAINNIADFILNIDYGNLLYSNEEEIEELIDHLEQTYLESEWLRVEGSQSGGGIYSKLPNNLTGGVTKTSKPKTDNKQMYVYSKEQNIKIIRLSLKKYIEEIFDEEMWLMSMIDERYITKILRKIISFLISPEIMELVRDCVSLRMIQNNVIMIDYNNPDRFAVAVDNVLKDSCSINKRPIYKNWQHFYNDIEHTGIKNTGLMQFSDGSYAQQLITIDDNEHNWMAVDLSFYIGLAAATAATTLITDDARRHHQLHRHRRSSSLLNNTNFTNGVLFVDRNERPTMAVFDVLDEYQKTTSFYWTGWGWYKTNNTGVMSMFVDGLSLSPPTSPIFQRCNGMPTKYGQITSQMKLLDEMLLDKANLAIVQREYQRTVRGDGFYFKKYNSWQEQYEAYSWSSLRDQGETMSGNSFKIWALGGFKFRHINYGHYFADGSFSVGISSRAIRNDDTDNWLFVNNRSAIDWINGNYYGQVFFNAKGQPTTLAVMSSFCFFTRYVLKKKNTLHFYFII